MYKIVNGVGGVNSEQWFKWPKMHGRPGDQENGSYEYSDPSQAGDKEKLFLSQSAGCMEQCPRQEKAGKDCLGF